jgi:hypothetical protein
VLANVGVSTQRRRVEIIRRSYRLDDPLGPVAVSDRALLHRMADLKERPTQW